jgi:hypothetical protein
MIILVIAAIVIMSILIAIGSKFMIGFHFDILDLR